MAELHAHGPLNYARGIAMDLLRDFLDAEEQFAANRGLTEQEVIESLRLVNTHPRAGWTRTSGYRMFIVE